MSGGLRRLRKPVLECQRVLRDQALCENMNRAVTEMRDVLADIRKDPRKFRRVGVSIF